MGNCLIARNKQIPNVGTYAADTRSSSIDLGLWNLYRYIDTSGVPNSNSTTYTPTSNGTKLDMGSTNTYRYVNTSTVYNLGVAAGKTAVKAQLYTPGYSNGSYSSTATTGTSSARTGTLYVATYSNESLTSRNLSYKNSSTWVSLASYGSGSGAKTGNYAVTNCTQVRCEVARSGGTDCFLAAFVVYE